MPPVAQRPERYPEGSPQRVLQDAVDDSYPDRVESFFDALAAKLKIQRDSASGSFYGFLKGRRSLPKSHMALYLELTAVTAETLDAIAAQRVTRSPRPRPQLEEEVQAMREILVQVADRVGIPVPDMLRESDERAA